MSERAADIVELQGRPRERNGARATILDAARRVATREGIEGTSLGAVADEAGVARASVYAQFRSKSDLLLSIVADDMTLLAQTMREAQGLPPYKPPTPTRIVRFDAEQMEIFRQEAATARAHNEPHAQDALEADALDVTAEVEPAPEPMFEAPVLPVEADAVASRIDADPQTAWSECSSPTGADISDCAETSPLEPTVFESSVNPCMDEPDSEQTLFPVAANADAIPAAGEGGAEEATAPADESERESAKPLEQRLPARGERIRIVGKRALASPELKETIKKLAPAHSVEGEAPAETVVKLQDAIAKLESGNADRLERRVNLLEHAVAELQARHDKADQMSAVAASTVQEALSKVVARIEDSEKRLRESMTRMMSEVRDAARRVDEMEFEHRSARAGAALVEPSFGYGPNDIDAQDNVHEGGAGDAAIEDGEGDRELDGGPDEERQDRPKTYLSAARASAVSAALLAEEFVAADHKRKAKRTRMLLVGVAGLASVLVVSGFALNSLSRAPVSARPPATPGSVRHMHILRHAVPAKVLHLKSASGAPLDKLTALANANNAQAELLIGLKYAAGDGVAKSDTEAEKWVARAAQQNEPVAQYWLGSFYEHGRGVAADAAQALAWYDKAASKGNRKAMHNLAIAYAEGKGVPVDFMQAARWFSQAAELGYVDSEFNLAVLYERGDGVPQSLLDAYKWYAVAAAQGDKESKTRMDAIATQLTADDLAAAEKAAQNFKPLDELQDANAAPKEALLIAQAH